MKIINAILFTALVCLSTLKAQNLRFYQVENFSHYQQVLALALEKEQLILTVLYQENGGFEKMILGDVFKNDSLRQRFAGLIPIAVDIKSEMGSRFAESFGAENLPAYFYLTFQELLVLSTSGEKSAAELITDLESAQQNQREYEKISEEYAHARLSPKQWLKLLEIHELNNDFLATQSLALEFLATLSDTSLLKEPFRSICLSYGIGLETPYPRYILENKADLDSLELLYFYESSYSFNMDLAIENKDSLLLQKVVDVLIPHQLGPDSLVDALIFESRREFAIETGLFDIWHRAAVVQSQKQESDSLKAEYLFAEAFTIADEYNSRKAQAAAKKLAAKAFKLRKAYRFKMLESYMAYLMQDYTHSLQLVETALDLAANADDSDKAERLKAMIKAEMN